MTQTAGIATILTTSIEQSTLSETASKKKTQQRSEPACLTDESNPSPLLTTGETSENSFLKVLNSKLNKKQTKPQIPKNSKKQEGEQNESSAEALLVKLSEALALPEKGLLKNPERPTPLNSLQTSEKNLPVLPGSPKSTSKSASETTSVSHHLNSTQIEKPQVKPSQTLQTTSTAKNESTMTETLQTHSSAGQKTNPASQELSVVSANKQNLIIQNHLKDSSAAAPNLPSKPLLSIAGPQPAVSGKPNESELEATAEIPSDKVKMKRSLNLSGAFDSTPNQESKDKNSLNADLFNTISVSSRLPQNTEAGIVTRSGIAVPEPAKVAVEADAPLSAPQQILRNLQTAVQSNVQTIQIALSPEGLGIVRIKFDKNGDEITGLLEVQKEQTRLEIEKSLPNILTSLENQGISIRKIEVSQMTNPEHRHANSDSPSDWNLRYEMHEERSRRPQSPDEPSRRTTAPETAVTPDPETGYSTHPDSKNLNLFI